MLRGFGLIVIDLIGAIKDDAKDKGAGKILIAGTGPTTEIDKDNGETGTFLTDAFEILTDGNAKFPDKGAVIFKTE